MNNFGPQAAALLMRPNPTIVVCPTAIYKAPMYICYDYICQYCPREDQGPQIIYLPQASSDPHHNSPAPRVYTRFYHDHRYQVYAVYQYELPPQESRIDSSPPIQRNWYYGQFGNPIRGVLQDNGTEAFTDPVSGHTVIHAPPAGLTIHPEARGPAGNSSEATSSIESLPSEVSAATPSLGTSSLRSRSSGSSALPLTPRSTYNTAGTYRLPAIIQAQEPMDEGEVAELRRGGAILVGEISDNDRTPTRDTFGGEGIGVTATPIARRANGGGVGGTNGVGTANINPPHGPRGGGNGRGQNPNRVRGGRPTRIWHARN
ncbi:hypothetical protein SBOR_3359 [Sclerotinia borealis F-4128]|uniref:Uncharacterized protein n=1 Tax=Sclerotinia borealis (strain F-4128) TaxID=1432307 RepID=W9CNY0_SCLBF|nr:hypothetical protein SBOR_3359 [Sclerotinia borealis F-4128]